MTKRKGPHAGLVLGIVLVLSLTVAGAIAPAAALQDNESVSTEENATAIEDVQGGPHSLEELRDGGREISGADPSMRWIGDTGSVFIDYPSADPLGPSAEDWEVENVLKSGSVVERDQLTINAQRERGAPDETYVMKVVTFETEHVDVSGEDEEVDVVEVATDQREHEHELHFTGAFDRQEIELQNTDGETRQVAMWLEDENGDRVEGAQWSFTHKSNPTSVDAGISTMGDLYQWVGVWVLLPGLVGIPLSIKVASKIHDRTGSGTMHSTAFYGVCAFVGLFMIVLFAWIEFSQFITRLPLILGISVVVVAFIGYLETGGNEIQRVQFVRDELADAVSPNGEDVQDTLFEETVDVRMTRLNENGEYVILRKGIRPFLARLFGVAPTLDVSDLETQIKMETLEVAKGDPWDKKFVADPEAESPLDWEPPRLTFPLTNDVDADDPSLVERLARIRWTPLVFGVLGASVGWFAGGAIVGLPTLGLLAGGLGSFLVAAARVEDGHAEFNAAPTHYTSARPQVLKASTDLSDAKTIDSLETIALEAQTDTALEGRRIMTNMDSTVSQRMNAAELGLGADDENPDPEDVDDRADESDETDEKMPVVRDD